MRIALITALAISATSIFVEAASAREGPWCAVISIGRGSVYEDCQYSSFQQCQPTVLAGNRGFCNLNPRYAANWPGYKPSGEPRHKRRAQQY